MQNGIQSSYQRKPDDFLSSKETLDVERKVQQELRNYQNKMIIPGGVTNILAGALVLWLFYKQVDIHLLLSWFTSLLFFQLMNMLVFLYYSKSFVFRICLGAIALIWGMLALLAMNAPINYQIYALIFILINVAAFGFGTLPDFASMVISLVSLLLPFIILKSYQAYYFFSDPTNPLLANIGLTLFLFMFAAFFLIAGAVGYQWLRKFFRLTFVNQILSFKLKNMNIILEKKVKERTAELVKSLKRATYLATHDLLTNLPNKRLLGEYIRESIKNSNRNHHMFAVVLCSLNEIDKVNDAFGHKMSDHIIKIIAERLKTTFIRMVVEKFQIHCSITLSRRDEFVILLQPIYNLEEIESAIEIIFYVLDEPIYTKKKMIQITCSAGVSIFPRDGKDMKSLLMNADAAMQQSRKLGGNHVSVYKPELNFGISKQLEMESDLFTAVKNKELTLNYQPIVDLKTGHICGAEALVRWKHPSLGYIPPGIFVQLAESNGMIVPLEAWVLETACQQMTMWHDQGYTSLKKMAVNLSAKKLMQTDIIRVLKEVLAKTRLSPKFLEFELTEAEAFNEEAAPVIRQFKALGVDLSIDDFGTGFSGLSMLKFFNVDKIKIDQSFVEDVTTSNESDAIVSNIINLAKRLNIKVVAEGVETKEQLDFLIKAGCDYIQGFYFSRPCNVENFTRLLVSKASLNVAQAGN